MRGATCGVRGEGEGWVEGRGGFRGQWGGEGGGQPAIDTGARARPRDEARPVVRALAIPAALPRLAAQQVDGHLLKLGRQGQGGEAGFGVGLGCGLG